MSADSPDLRADERRLYEVDPDSPWWSEDLVSMKRARFATQLTLMPTGVVAILVVFGVWPVALETTIVLLTVLSLGATSIIDAEHRRRRYKVRRRPRFLPALWDHKFR